jgi:hypothetical protein
VSTLLDLILLALTWPCAVTLLLSAALPERVCTRLITAVPTLLDSSSSLSLGPPQAPRHVHQTVCTQLVPAVPTLLDSSTSSSVLPVAPFRRPTAFAAPTSGPTFHYQRQNQDADPCRHVRRRNVHVLRPRPPALTRSIVPGLTKIQFKGASEYLEEILARIDAPRLFSQIIFDTPQLFQFISRRPMAGSFTFICCCEESLLIEGICTTYCVRTARACWGPDDRGAAHPGEYFLGDLEGFQPLGPKGIEQFFAARRLTSHPVAVSPLDRESTARSLFCNYPSLSVSLTFLVVSLPPQFSFALVFFDILTTMIDICRLITCVGWRRRQHSY